MSVPFWRESAVISTSSRLRKIYITLEIKVNAAHVHLSFHAAKLRSELHRELKLPQERLGGRLELYQPV